MKTLYSSLFLSLALVSGTCSAQWLWVDANGTKVYSDQPPPHNIPDKNVLKKPTGLVAAPLEQTQNAIATDKKEAKNAASATSSSADAKLLEAQKAQAEKQKIAKADRCKNAKKDLIALNSGIRISTFNDKGEREFMDEKKRNEEVKAKQKTIDADC